MERLHVHSNWTSNQRKGYAKPGYTVPMTTHFFTKNTPMFQLQSDYTSPGCVLLCETSDQPCMNKYLWLTEPLIIISKTVSKFDSGQKIQKGE